MNPHQSPRSPKSPSRSVRNLQQMQQVHSLSKLQAKDNNDSDSYSKSNKENDNQQNNNNNNNNDQENDNDNDEQSSSLEFLGNDDNQDKQNEDYDNQKEDQDQQDVNVMKLPTKRRTNNSVMAMSNKQQNINAQTDKTQPRRRQRPSSQPQPQSQIQQDSLIPSNPQSTFLYKSTLQLPIHTLHNFTNMTIKVIIAAQYINKDNPAVIRSKIYGTDTYTADSDVLCIALHYGLFSFAGFNTRKYQGVQVTFKVIKPKKTYIGSLKNSIQSSSTKSYTGNALKPQQSRLLPSLPPLKNLQRYALNMRIQLGKFRIKSHPININSIIPLPVCHLVFNMNHQPAFKYSIYNIADHGFQKSQFLVRKLDNKVLYLQTQNKQKYQLSKYIQKKYFQAYRFVKLRNPNKFDNQYFSMHSVPVTNPEQAQVLQSVVQWDQILFGIDFVKIKERKIQNLVSFKYYPIQDK